MKNLNQFYKQLGNLFYAIAAADRVIRPEEKVAMEEEIQYGWKHFEESQDRFGSDRAFVIEYEFDFLEENFASAEAAFDLFKDYFKEFGEEMDETLRKRVFNSARHIAESARKINAEELALLMKLKVLLEL